MNSETVFRESRHELESKDSKGVIRKQSREQRTSACDRLAMKTEELESCEPQVDHFVAGKTIVLQTVQFLGLSSERNPRLEIRQFCNLKLGMQNTRLENLAKEPEGLERNSDSTSY